MGASHWTHDAALLLSFASFWYVAIWVADRRAVAPVCGMWRRCSRLLSLRAPAALDPRLTRKPSCQTLRASGDTWPGRSSLVGLFFGGAAGLLTTPDKCQAVLTRCGLVFAPLHSQSRVQPLYAHDSMGSHVVCMRDQREGYFIFSLAQVSGKERPQSHMLMLCWCCVVWISAL